MFRTRQKKCVKGRSASALNPECYNKLHRQMLESGRWQKRLFPQEKLCRPVIRPSSDHHIPFFHNSPTAPSRRGFGLVQSPPSPRRRYLPPTRIARRPESSGRSIFHLQAKTSNGGQCQTGNPSYIHASQSADLRVWSAAFKASRKVLRWILFGSDLRVLRRGCCAGRAAC